MQIEAELEHLAGGLKLLGVGNSPPFVNVSKNHVDGAHAQALRQLVEVHHAHIGGERNVHPLAHPAHRLVSPAGVLVVLDVERLDQLADAN